MPAPLHPIYLPPALREFARSRGYSEIGRATSSGVELLQDCYGVPMRPAPDELRRPLGHTGVRPMAGQVDYLEQNPKLIPTRWRGEREPGVVHNMVRADSACAAVYNVWRRHLGRVPIDVEPAKGGDANDLRLAEFVRACLWEYMRGGFDAWRAEASAYPVMTPMAWEIVWGVDDRAGRAHGIDGPAVILQALEPRLAWTINRWVADAGEWSMVQWPEYGDPDAGRRQTGYGAPAAPLHWSKLLRLTHDGIGGDPEGVSLMRPAWWPYQLRQILGPLIGVTARKTAHGVPVARPTTTANPGDADTVARMLRFYGAGAESYLMLDMDGWDLDVIKLEGDIDKIQAVYAAAARDIAVGALAHALFTGADGTGSFALIDGQQDPYALAVDDACQGKVRPWNQGPFALIKRLIDFNVPNVRAYPFLRVGRLPFGSLSSYLGMVQAAVTSGSMLPDADLDAWQREQVGAPPMRPETVEAWRHRQRNPGPAPEVGNDPSTEPPPSGPTPALPPSEPASEERSDDTTERAQEGQAVRQGAGLALADPFVAPDPDVPEKGPRGRKARPVETCLRLSETTGRTTRAKEEIGKIITEWRGEVGKTLIERMVAAKDIKATRAIRVPNVRDLAARLREAYWHVYLAGAEAVTKETARLRRSPELKRRAASGALEVGKGGDLGTPKQLHDHGPGCDCDTGPAFSLVAYLSEMAARPLLLASYPDDGDGSDEDRPQVNTSADWADFREEVEDWYKAHPDLFQPLGGDAYRTRPPPPLDRDEYFADYAAAVQEFYARHPEFAGLPLPTPEHIDDPISQINPARAIDGVAGTTADKVAARLRDTLVDGLQNQTIAGAIRSPTEEEARTIGRVHQRVQEEIEARDLSRALEEILGEMTTRADEDAAGLDVQTLFGFGRSQQVLAEVAVGSLLYSALLESASCDECLAHDGNVYPVDRLVEVSTPASWCRGGARCRCLLILIPD